MWTISSLDSSPFLKAENLKKVLNIRFDLTLSPMYRNLKCTGIWFYAIMVADIKELPKQTFYK